MMLESEMMKMGFEYLNKNKKFRLVKQEVPFLSRCIDVVIIDESERLISIEFKVNKWRHAIEQAKNHKLGSDEAYICLPKRKLTDSLIKALQDEGIGLMFFDPESDDVISEAISANRESTNVPIFRKMLVTNVMNIS